MSEPHELEEMLVERIATMIYGDVQFDSSLWPELEEYRKQDYRSMAMKAIAMTRSHTAPQEK